MQYQFADASSDMSRQLTEISPDAEEFWTRGDAEVALLWKQLCDEVCVPRQGPRWRKLLPLLKAVLSGTFVQAAVERGSDPELAVRLNSGALALVDGNWERDSNSLSWRCALWDVLDCVRLALGTIEERNGEWCEEHGFMRRAGGRGDGEASEELRMCPSCSVGAAATGVEKCLLTWVGLWATGDVYFFDGVQIGEVLSVKVEDGKLSLEHRWRSMRP